MRKLLIICLLGCLPVALPAQELAATVEVVHDRIQNVDAGVFQALQKGLNDFLNNRRWTKDQFKNSEKIQCSFLLNITSKTKDDNVYQGILTIQATRPVFNSSYHSPTVNYQDKELVFRFDESQNLQFDLNNVSGSDPLVSNLTAVFAYYVYLIIGLDYDSFAPRGGSDFFRDAQRIVNNAPEQGKTIVGWKSSDGNRNRYWLVEQLLNPRFASFRAFWYTYHRRGLDVLTTDKEAAQKEIFSGIPDLAKIYNENTAPILLQFYFNAKSAEWVSLVQNAPAEQRKELAEQLKKIDVPNASQYNRIR